jgi:hypothetical protein
VTARVVGHRWGSPGSARHPWERAGARVYHYLLDADRPLAADAGGLAAPMLSHAKGMAADPAVLRAASLIMSAMACAAFPAAVPGSAIPSAV